MRILDSIDKALSRFEKSVDVSFAGGTPSSLLARQDLESVLVVLSDRMTPFRDRVTRIKGEGLASFQNWVKHKIGYMLESPVNIMAATL